MSEETKPAEVKSQVEENSAEITQSQLVSEDVEPKPTSSTTTTTIPTIISPNLNNQQHELDKKILEELSREMIKSTGEYIKGELDVCAADYKMLEQMNKLVTDKYRALSGQSGKIITEMDKLNEAYAHLVPLLSQIESVEKSVDELEVTSNKLDVYSKRLEAKFKQFTDRIGSNRWGNQINLFVSFLDSRLFIKF